MSTTQTRRKPADHVLPDAVLLAARAAYAKKATDVVVLNLGKVSAFTDYFLICTGQHPRQVKAIAEAIEVALAAAGTRPADVEGYDRSDWILLDYFDFVVHVFTADQRRFYGLERLWGSADFTPVPDTAA
ncbi:MAG: ribosome silencing factor [Acidobacteria bacterium]|nr:ribosome silencing factor [Acidobacteriota bacterium]